ncbi:MAG: triose-phosphate isomerase [Pseudomonadota bacterium]
MTNCWVIGNWKMHGNPSSLSAWLNEWNQLFSEKNNLPQNHFAQNYCGLCLPFPLLAVAQNNTSTMQMGAQDVSQFPNEGAFTGEVSADILKSIGCDYVIVGHSERRELLKETDTLIATKVQRALDAKLTAILCVGELAADREKGNAYKVVQQQLQILETLDIPKQSLIIAYEPVWAIGTGKIPVQADIEQMHEFIKQEGARFTKNQLEPFPVLYGGSVKPENAADIFSYRGVDGGLIGGASLRPSDFFGIFCASLDRHAGK